MTLEEIEFELEMTGMSREQLMKILSSVKRSGYDAKALDQKLRLMGFPPAFSIYDDDEDEESDKKA